MIETARKRKTRKRTRNKKPIPIQIHEHIGSWCDDKINTGGRYFVYAICLIITSIAIVFSIHVKDQEKTLQEYKSVSQQLQKEINEEELRAQKLQDEKVRIKTDEYKIEKAREIYGLTLPGEIVIKPDNAK